MSSSESRASGAVPFAFAGPHVSVVMKPPHQLTIGLHRSHPMDAGSYRETHRVTKNGQSSDVSTVIELLQAVSAERVVERVVEAVVASAVRHVGAARAQLVLCQGAADGEKACATDDASAIGSRLALPVRRGERLLGVLCLEFAAPSAAPSPGQLFLAELLASQAAMSLEHARHYESAGKENQKRREAAAQSERVQTALKESEARFRLMADTTPDIIWITQLDPERVVYASPSFERVFGKTVADLYANPHLWIEGIHPEDRERVGASFVAWIGADSGEPWEVEFRVVHPNGSVRWIHDRGVFTGEAGGPQRVSGIATDITERHLAQVALRESEQRYALAMDAARDGHWDWVAETDNFDASPRMLEIYGFPPETRFSGRQDFLDRFPFHPEDKARWYAAASEHFAGETARFDIEIRLLRGAEVRWIHTTGLIARDPHGRPTRYTGSVNDITVRKDAEAALRASEHFRRRAEAALQQAQRLEASARSPAASRTTSTTSSPPSSATSRWRARVAAGQPGASRPREHADRGRARARALVRADPGLQPRRASASACPCTSQAVVERRCDSCCAPTAAPTSRFSSTLDGGRAATSRRADAD